MYMTYKDFKTHAAPLYQNELDRHLFATASGGRAARRRRDEHARREWLRARWLKRFKLWRQAETAA